MAEKLVIANHPGEIKDFVVENNKDDYDFYFLKEKKGRIFANKLLKYILENQYKKIYVFGSCGVFDESLLGGIYKVDRTFLFNSDIIDNQRFRYGEEDIGLENMNINTVFDFGNYPDLMQEFGRAVDMEAFWVAGITTQLAEKIFMIKAATDVVDKNKKYSDVLQDEEFENNLIQANKKFDEFLRGNYEISGKSKKKSVKIINAGKNWEKYFENPVENNLNSEEKNIRVLHAEKKGNFVREKPVDYGPSGSRSFSLLRGYNCFGGCEYCYLQSYFKSPDLVQFINTDEYLDFLKGFISENKRETPEKKLIFYDGDFQDSLGFHNIRENIHQLNKFIDFFEQYENVDFEIRTKCIVKKKEYLNKIYSDLKIGENTVYGITFSPQIIIDRYEKSTSDLDIRVALAQMIINKGGKVGIRIDPVVFDEDSLDKTFSYYQQMLDFIKEQVPQDGIKDVSIGVLRIKPDLYKKLNQKGNSLVKNLEKGRNFYKYNKQVREKIYQFFREKLDGFAEKYVCMDEEGFDK